MFAPALALLGLSAVAAAAPQAQRAATPLPAYVLEYAPISYLAATEAWWPADVAAFLPHVAPRDTNGALLAPAVDLTNLTGIAPDTSGVFLTSRDTVTDDGGFPWLWANDSIPDATGLTAAPATIIAVDKSSLGNNTVDAFYFYFYAYDHAAFLDIPMGNHVGDWEHTMVRFENGVPQYISLSAHGAGYAFTYPTLIAPTSSGRAVTYIAYGSHANYFTSGTQLYPNEVIGPLADHTSVGPVWDVTLNYRGFWYDNATATFTGAGGAGVGGASQEAEGADWLNYVGTWGDKQYPISLSRDQYCVSSDECHWVSGPTGPVKKNLGRDNVCQDESDCTIRTSK